VDGQDISKYKAKKLQSKCHNNVAVGIYTERLTSLENKNGRKLRLKVATPIHFL